MCTSVLPFITIIVVSIQLSSCNINCRNYPFAPKCRGIILKKSVLSLKANREIVEEDENPIIKLFQQKRLVPMLLTNLKPENLQCGIIIPKQKNISLLCDLCCLPAYIGNKTMN
ncbi:Protein snet-1 [Trichinella spiralis]|uniref:Protein snet-1 n=1 Tax=Trichinella spiralis TaxID=6334 RepID=A0ABR3KDD1_TRISP